MDKAHLAHKAHSLTVISIMDLRRKPWRLSYKYQSILYQNSVEAMLLHEVPSREYFLIYLIPSKTNKPLYKNY